MVSFAGILEKDIEFVQNFGLRWSPCGQLLTKNHSDTRESTDT